MPFTTYSTVSDKTTPQTEPIPGTDMQQNNAGGYAFVLDPWKRLERFLVLGSEGGTYYVGDRKLTQENATCVLECAKLDARRTVDTIVAVSDSGRAPKNDPALFALALVASGPDLRAREMALIHLPLVARTGTHLFHFAAFVNEHRGWGRSLRTWIAEWYRTRTPADLAYQVVKYQSRDGWSHRDLLRLTHPKIDDARRNEIIRWAVKGWPDVGPLPPEDPALRVIWAFETAKRATDPAGVATLIRAYNLPREAVPSEMLKERAVWDALAADMPITALIRNLPTMTRVGLLRDLDPDYTSLVAERLQEPVRLRKGRVHPLQMLVALKTYAQGKSERGSATWTPVQKIVDALDAGFYHAFDAVPVSGKRLMLALDVSGSMTMGTIAGMPGVSPRVAGAAMALVTANVEPSHVIVGFTASGSTGSGRLAPGFKLFSRTDPAKYDPDQGIAPLAISPRQRLDDVVRYTNNLDFGATDCALPMLYATKHQIPVDAFVIYTDNETWAGPIQPVQALKQYRDAMHIPAKLVVVGMTATEFTVADPNDADMLDVVGFDTATPNVIADFIAR